MGTCRSVPNDRERFATASLFYGQKDVIPTFASDSKVPAPFSYALSSFGKGLGSLNFPTFDPTWLKNAFHQKNQFHSTLYKKLCLTSPPASSPSRRLL